MLNILIKKYISQVKSITNYCPKLFSYSEGGIARIKSNRIEGGRDFTVLPHLANFHNSCEFEGLIATQKRSFVTCNFFANFEFQKILIRILPKSFKNEPQTDYFFPSLGLFL